MQPINVNRLLETKFLRLPLRLQNAHASSADMKAVTPGQVARPEAIAGIPDYTYVSAAVNAQQGAPRRYLPPEVHARTRKRI